MRSPIPGMDPYIEILSPSNKRPNTKGWRLYYRKRLAYLSGRANFVEIDLLRRGQRMPMASPWPDSPYYLLVCRKEQAPRCTVWPAGYRDRLEPIPIPLAPPDADVTLDIQPLLERIYTRSGYDVEMNCLALARARDDTIQGPGRRSRLDFLGFLSRQPAPVKEAPFSW